MKHAAGVGSGIVWLSGVVNNSADSDVDQQRRRGKHDEIKNSCGSSIKEKHVILENMIPSAPPSPPFFLKVCERRRGRDLKINSLWTKCKFLRFRQVIHSMLVPAGSSDEIEVTFLPRDERVVARDGGVWLEAGCVSCARESTDSRTLEELVVCSGPHEGGGSVQAQDQTLGEGVACDTLEGERLLYRCQGVTSDERT